MWFSCDSHSLSRSTQTDATILPKDADLAEWEPWRASHNLEMSPPQLYCDEGTFENTLNDLDHGGYVPWELRYIDVQDSQDSVNPRKVVRILAHGNG